MRAQARAIEESRGGRESIIISEIPYQENKARLHERIAEVVRDKKVEGIAEVRDESDRDGVRLVVELKRDAMADVVLNQLYRYTPLQTNFGVNALALDGGRPRLMSLKELLEAFIRFRAEVLTRRTKYELRHARDRAHVLVGLAIAVANIDEVIEMIRRAPDPVVGARAPDGARLAGRRRGAADRPDRRARPRGLGRGQLQAVRGAGPRHPRIAPAAPDRPGARQDRRGAGRGRPADRGLSRAARRSRQAVCADAQGAARDQGAVRHAAAHRDPRQRVRAGHRGPDPARGHGRHGDARRLRQARAGLGLSRPAPRRQGPLRHGHARGRFRRAACSSPTPIRRCCSSPAAASSTSSRSGACRWARRRRAARPSSTCCRSARARRSARSCRCPRTRRAGRRST